MKQDARQTIERALGHTFADPALLERALTHASLADQRSLSNERMEFLGDAVLGLVVCERLYQRYPDMLEGEMTKIKSLIVSRQVCATLAQSLGLPAFLAVGKGMKGGSGGAEPPLSLAAATFEAVIAAVYLDAGLASARAVLEKLVDPAIDEAVESGHQQNFKSYLQQFAQQKGEPTPVYRVLDEQGPDHAKCFKVCAELGGRRFTPSWGQTKKRAEQAAALNALRELGLVDASDRPAGGGAGK